MWEVVHTLVEVITKGEVGDGMWQVVYWLVEAISKLEMSNGFR